MFGNLGPEVMVTADKGPTSEAPDVHKSFGHLPVSRLNVPAYVGFAKCKNLGLCVRTIDCR